MKRNEHMPRCAIISEIPIPTCGNASLSGEPPPAGRLFLGSVQAVFALGSGDNPWNINAVLSCLPEVNQDINHLVSASGIAHHQYFLLDDNDATALHTRHNGAPLTAPCSACDIDALANSLSKVESEADDDEGELTLRLPSMSVPATKPNLSTHRHPCENSFDSFDSSSYELAVALDFVHSSLSCGRNVLVHCDGGVLRSPATVVSYLMRFMQMPMSEAKALVSLHRPEVRLRLLEDRLSALEQSFPCGALAATAADQQPSLKLHGQKSLTATQVDISVARSSPLPLEEAKVIPANSSDDLCDWVKEECTSLLSTAGASFETNQSCASPKVEKPELFVRIV